MPDLRCLAAWYSCGALGSDFAIDEELARMGYRTPAARGLARRVLEEAGLTRPGKRRMAVTKRELLRTALAGAFLLACPGCEELAGVQAVGRQVIIAEATSCDICGGSGNRRHALRAVEALVGAGKRRLVVVGGSPSTRQELLRLFSAQIEMRFVDGASAHRRRDADGLIAWAEIIVVWGSTEIPHKVSDLYSGAPSARGKIVQVPRRGVGALCQAVCAHLGKSAGGPVSDAGLTS
jgi:hypothetical protein